MQKYLNYRFEKKRIMRRYRIYVLLLLPIAVFGHQSSKGVIEGEIIVELKNTRSKNLLLTDKKLQEASFELSANLSEDGKIVLCTFSVIQAGSEEILNYLKKNKAVKQVQLNYLLKPRNTPNDVHFAKQWGLSAMGIEGVWTTSTGGMTVNGQKLVLAIIDFGFDALHPDLIPNRWTNRGEIPGDGIDNDGNGYVDDWYGWNFIQKNNTDNKSAHGTSVAGIAGAKGNNGIGIAGINWDIELMLLSVQSSGQIIEAYQYVLRQRRLYNQSNGNEGALVVATNASFGVNNVFCESQPIWASQYDLLGEQGVLTAAGTANSNVNVDVEGDMPTTCTTPYIITTLNIDETGRKVSNSAFGKISIDLGSPGDNSFTLKPDGAYGSFGGTSAAAPHLTGTIALLYSMPCKMLEDKLLSDPSGAALMVRQAILEGVVSEENLKEYTVTGGKLNAFESARILSEQCSNQGLQSLALKLLYPIPARDLLILETQLPQTGKYQFTIYDVSGKKIKTESRNLLAFETVQTQINLFGFAPGYYVLELSDGKNYTSKPFIVQ
jgi:hypothetical protein